MQRSERATRVCGRAAVLAFATSVMVAAASAEGAYPGKAGPIAYSKVSNVGAELSGGLLLHGPLKSDTPEQLTNDPQDNTPSFSADGRQIVFEGLRDPGEFARGTHIYVMKSNGSEVKQLTSGDFYDSNPSFSPNRKQVVFDRGGLQGHLTHIFSVNVDGSGLPELNRCNGFAGGSSWQCWVGVRIKSRWWDSSLPPIFRWSRSTERRSPGGEFWKRWRPRQASTSGVSRQTIT